MALWRARAGILALALLACLALGSAPSPCRPHLWDPPPAGAVLSVLLRFAR